MPRVRKIAPDWIKHGMDPLFLLYLVMRVREEVGVRQERLHDSRIRRNIESASGHLEKAQTALRSIPHLAFAADYIGAVVIEALCERIEGVRQNLSVLGGKPLPRGRPGEDHITRFMFVLCEDLRERTGRPHWREIAAFVNDLGLEQHLTARYVQTRCFRYRPVEPDALEKARQEARRFWEGSEGDTDLEKQKF